MQAVPNLRGLSAVRAEDGELGTRWLYTDREVPVLVTENETNNELVFGSANETPYVKDGIDRAVVHGDAEAVNPAGAGTKAASVRGSSGAGRADPGTPGAGRPATSAS